MPNRYLLDCDRYRISKILSLTHGIVFFKSFTVLS
nr:MAG TPA: hypothetical protein [Caudoviricetes sp.]DAU20562.1 MAG TPA: hypothetical protein [Caudoviricetes sp.]